MCDVKVGDTYKDSTDTLIHVVSLEIPEDYKNYNLDNPTHPTTHCWCKFLSTDGSHYYGPTSYLYLISVCIKLPKGELTDVLYGE